ncbi:ABC transporter permease [Deinococcus psychrotolerans]|uniref:ABC transporter permease n=1 Tax=Deinococcus psychrotolerans TaxID=2489213 RepID=A0A3G8Y965_9DEIO|nr:FtsX-like permease family protein [Deinococcus psychrotolerans]AZI41912.1 ABC transporter permease [Deinococcus psychrotolerans]
MPAPSRPPAPTSLPLTLARAHLRRRRTQNLSTVLGIAVGVMVLIAALSLTNGFTGALIQATLRATPHLSLTRFTPGGADPEMEKALRQNKDVVAFMPFLADKGLLTRPASDGRGAGLDFATLFGVSAEAGKVLGLPPEESQLLATLKPNEVLLGSALAQSLGAFQGQELRLLAGSTQRRSALKVAGIFRSGNYLIDSAYAFVPLGTLQQIQGNTHISGYQARLKDPDLAPQVGQTISRALPYSSLPWQNLYGSLLDQLKLQKQVIGFVVFLIVIVAAFGIANVLTLTVFEKTPEIAILRAMGASRRQIIWAFVWQGAALGAAGLLLGNVLGLAISLYFTWRPFQIPGDLYFITALPVQVRLSDLLWVNALGISTTLLAALLPARRAAGIEPARIIR